MCDVTSVVKPNVWSCGEFYRVCRPMKYEHVSFELRGKEEKNPGYEEAIAMSSPFFYPSQIFSSVGRPPAPKGRWLTVNINLYRGVLIAPRCSFQIKNPLLYTKYSLI